MTRKWIGLFMGVVLLRTLAQAQDMAAIPVQAHDVLAVITEADVAYDKREDLGHARLALSKYEQAAEMDPHVAVDCLWKAARAAWWVGEHEKSRADKLAGFKRGMDDAQKAITLNPNSVEAHFWLGGNEGSFGDTQGVMKSLSLVKPIRHEMAEVIRLSERYNNGSAWQVLGVVDYKVPGIMGGSKARALEELGKALAIGPDDPFNHYYMAEYWKTVGEKEKLEAELALLKKLKVVPDLAPELRMLQAKAQKELM